ncbi:hypothetical protein JCM9279_002717 [Rhodotorula babjevae]
MLKRISGTFASTSSDPAFLLAPPPPSPGARGSKPASPRSSPRLSPTPLASPRPSSAASNAYPFPPQPQEHPGIDRATLHKSLAALSALLVALDDLRSLKLQHAKAQRRVAKALKDLAGGFTGDGKGAGASAAVGRARSDVVVEALGAAGTMLDALGETEGKHAKVVQKEYEALNDSISKYFKRTAKEEKVYEDTIASLDAKVAKATSSYQSASTSSSSSRSNPHAHLDTLTSHHSSYMTTLSSLSSHLSTTKASYAGAIAARREAVAREVGRSVCALAEHEWRSRIDGAKKGGGLVLGRVVGAARWCEVGMESAAGLFELAEDEGAREGEVAGRDAPLVPSCMADDEQRAARDARGDEPGRSGTLRGPRAPSTSTTQTAATATTTTTSSSGAHSPRPSVSSAPSFTSRTTSSSGGGVSFAPPPSTQRDSSSTPRPPPPPASPSRYPASPHDGRDTLRSDTFRDAGTAAASSGRELPREWAHDAQARSGLAHEHAVSSRPQARNEAPTRAPLSPQDDGALTRSAAVEGVLRRPTPRYGSAPARASTRAAAAAAEDVVGERSEAAAVDEFGRRREGPSDERARSGPTPQRHDSFVARMSAKYASGDGHHERDLPHPVGPPATAGAPASAQPTHARSSSRVSLLAKRYSSPPDAAFPASSPTAPAPAAISNRPAPPPRGWTDAPRASAPYPPASPSPPPPQRWGAVPPPPHSPPEPPRRRAYESASPIPPAPRAPAPMSPPAPPYAHAGYAHTSLPRPAAVRDAEDEREREAAHAQVQWSREEVEERWRAGTWTGREWREDDVAGEAEAR